MRALLVLVVLAAMTTLVAPAQATDAGSTDPEVGQPATPSPGPGPTPDPGPDPFPGTVAYVIGDSTAWRASEALQARRPDWQWHIDAVRGSLVTSLPGRLRAMRDAHGAAPDVLFVALGTNASPHWTKGDYARARWLVSKRTRVVFVAPYVTRSARGRRAHDRVATYARWMNEIARRQPNTGVAPWRAAALRRPGQLLVDGVHQTDPYGLVTWASKAVGRSWLMGVR